MFRTSWFHGKFCHPSVSNKVRVDFSPLLDVNECATYAHNCDANALCSNTEGSYNCTCSPGYIGNGTSCTGKLSWSMHLKKNNIFNPFIYYYYYYYYYFLMIFYAFSPGRKYIFYVVTGLQFPSSFTGR